MNEPRGAGGPLRTIVVAMSIPEPAISRLRAEFPEIRFVVPGEDDGSDERYRLAPAIPDERDLAVADGLIGWELDSGMLEIATRLRWMHAASAGVDHFNLGAIAARGITLTNSRGVFAPNIAEHVLGMMLALARRFPRLMQAQAVRAWRDEETHREVGELQGQTLLIVGTGEIGRAVAARAAAFGMRVHGVRRTSAGRPLAGFDRVFALAALHEALASADHVAIMLPETPGTRGLIDARAIAAMKPGAIIYNAGRGSAIDTAALIAALQAGHLGGAGLDVTEPEPLPADSPLWSMDNVMVTAHTSGATPRYWARQGALIAESIGRMQQGLPPLNIVDLEAGY